GGNTSIPEATEVVRLNGDGRLDSTFGSAGEALVPASTEATDMAVQPDVKIDLLTFTSDTFSKRPDVWGLTRLKSDGTVDPSFGAGGYLTVGVGSGNRIIPLADGKILTSGSLDGLEVLLRFNVDGTSDRSFGSGGAVLLKTAGEDLAVQADGKVVVVGSFGAGFFVVNRYVVYRYNADGSIDETFAADGQTALSFGSDDESQLWGRGIAIQPDGRMVVVGSAADSTNPEVVAVARLAFSGPSPGQ